MNHKPSGFVLEKLPYAENALEPHISAKTLSFHYGKHHAGYVEKLNSLCAGTNYAHMSLEEVMRESAKKPESVAIFNNAAQTWNHSFYWKSLAPKPTTPSPAFKKNIEKQFGSFENFKKQLLETALAQFGSGWTWLVEDEFQLKIIKTVNADNPLIHGHKPLFTIDVWEHAYYLDYQNKRAVYLEAVIEHLLNWEFAEKNRNIS